MLVKGCFDQLMQLIENSKRLNKIGFFYTPPNDFHHYHITCELLEKAYLGNNLALKGENGLSSSKNKDINYPFDYTFFYQLEGNNYKISCCLISQSLIYTLFRNSTRIPVFHGNVECLTFSDSLRENLENCLKQGDLKSYLKLASKGKIAKL